MISHEEFIIACKTRDKHDWLDLESVLHSKITEKKYKILAASVFEAHQANDLFKNNYRLCIQFPKSCLSTGKQSLVGSFFYNAIELSDLYQAYEIAKKDLQDPLVMEIIKKYIQDNQSILSVSLTCSSLYEEQKRAIAHELGLKIISDPGPHAPPNSPVNEDNNPEHRYNLRTRN